MGYGHDHWDNARSVWLVVGVAAAVFGVAAILAICVATCFAEPVPIASPELDANRTAAMAERALKIQDAWVNMKTQLDQYDAHYADATNKIAGVSDPATRSALLKTLRATDDVHDALVKLIKCFREFAELKRSK